LYFVYGIHKGFGLDFDPITGNIWDTETSHFPYNDEINLVMPGYKSGFGIIQGMSKFFPHIQYAMFNFNGSGKYSGP
jgi:aldose sugar dehydrogenase